MGFLPWMTKTHQRKDRRSVFGTTNDKFGVPYFQTNATGFLWGKDAMFLVTRISTTLGGVVIFAYFCYHATWLWLQGTKRNQVPISFVSPGGPSRTHPVALGGAAWHGRGDATLIEAAAQGFPTRQKHGYPGLSHDTIV